MIIMNGLRGLGAGLPDANECADELGPDRTTAQMVACVNGQTIPPGDPGPGASGAGSFSWLTALAQGAAAGLTTTTAHPVVYAPPPAPWYTTPVGMLGLGGGIIALILLLRN